MKSTIHSKLVGIGSAVLMFYLSAAAHAEVVSEDEVHEMELHWDSVIHEKDPDKQKDLIREHREIMKRYSSREDLRNIHRASSKEKMEHNMDIINTIDMHKNMMWMLERMKH